MLLIREMENYELWRLSQNIEDVFHTIRVRQMPIPFHLAVLRRSVGLEAAQRGLDVAFSGKGRTS